MGGVQATRRQSSQERGMERRPARAAEAPSSFSWAGLVLVGSGWYSMAEKAGLKAGRLA